MTAMRQLPLPIVPTPEDGFEALVIGPNAQAVEHLRTLAAPAAPVYLWGAPGSGKTRLLRALATHRQTAGERVGWFDAATPLPWDFDPGWSLLVLDDAQALDAGRQQAAFAQFVEAGTHGTLWAAAGSLPPVDLPLRDDLRTRLGWGHVFALEPLSEAETRAALRREADRRGILLNDDVMNYLLTRLERNLGHLMGLLDRLDGFALAEQRGVTVPLVKRMLAEPCDA